MKTTMNKIMIALQALAAALLIGAIKIWAPVCGITGVVLAVALGFVSAVSPALKSASMDPQTAITRGEVN